MVFNLPAYLRLIACCVLCATAITAAAAEFTFGALGDAPYSTQEEAQFIAVLGEMNRETLAFAVHIGDFKSSHSVCSDKLYLQRRQWFGLSHHPFIYTPGDNEWSDCARTKNGSYDPLERLAKLREIFFDTEFSLGQRTLTLARQSNMRGTTAHPYPEHARWIVHGVMFVTLNVAGGGNNMRRMPQEFAARDAAARDWLRLSFDVARTQNLRGLVVMMQANPWAGSPRQRLGYAGVMETLTAEVLKFKGAVAMIHGDTHRFRVDNPLRHPESPKPLANFTRIEVFGSPNVNWVRVRVHDEKGRLKFDVTPGS
jgi:hypothetical protein